jgi:LacI family transcriptional regulator
MSDGDRERLRRSTMKDVAKRAGVSQPTVSFVLNDRQDISVAAETRKRIQQAARDLNFVPNRAAQSLRSNRPFTIGVITQGVVSQPYAGQLVLGIQQAVQPAGYVSFVVEISDTPDNGQAAVENLVRQGVAGLVYAAPGPEPVQAIDIGSDTRTLFVNCWAANREDAPLVLADEYQGGKDAAAAVFAAGHRRVAFLGGPAADYACKERERGLDDAASEAGIDPRWIRKSYGTYHVSSGYDLAAAVLQGTAPTALICGNDRMAVGALLAAHASGYECPRDISIVGFDDQPELASELHPPLATVALPHLLMGVIAGSLLISDQKLPARTLVPCRYVDRASLGAPRASVA